MVVPYSNHNIILKLRSDLKNWYSTAINNDRRIILHIKYELNIGMSNVTLYINQVDLPSSNMTIGMNSNIKLHVVWQNFIHTVVDKIIIIVNSGKIAINTEKAPCRMHIAAIAIHIKLIIENHNFPLCGMCSIMPNIVLHSFQI